MIQWLQGSEWARSTAMEPTLTPDDAANPLVTTYAQACGRFVQQAVGVALDGTGDTLPILDHYVEQFAGTRASHLEVLTVAMCGAYFGEVVCRELGGEWVDVEPMLTPENGASDKEDANGTGVPDPVVVESVPKWKLVFPGTSLVFHPLAVAEEIVRNESPSVDALGPSHFQLHASDRALAEKALADLGEVREEDYYRFTTRYEAITEVLVVLRKQVARA